MAVYRRIAEKIVEEYDFDWEDNPRRKEICITSVEMLCANVLDVAIILLIVLLMGVAREALVFFLTFGILRLYAGGGHAKNYALCVTIYTTVLLVSIWYARSGAALPAQWLYGLMVPGMIFATTVNLKYAGCQRNIGSPQNKFRTRALVILGLIECGLLVMGVLVSCLGEGALQSCIKEFAYLQIFALVAQSIALYFGRRECLTDARVLRKRRTAGEERGELLDLSDWTL